MALFTSRQSVHGRQLLLSSTGGLLVNNTTAPSTGFDQVVVTRDSTGALLSPHDEPVVTTTSTGNGALMTFGGVLAINSSVVNPSYLIGTPRAGQSMEIYFISTLSTTISFGGTSTAVTFVAMGGVSAGTTIITFNHAAPCGNMLMLRGLSATKFGVVYNSTAAWT